MNPSYTLVLEATLKSLDTQHCVTLRDIAKSFLIGGEPAPEVLVFVGKHLLAMPKLLQEREHRRSVTVNRLFVEERPTELEGVHHARVYLPRARLKSFAVLEVTDTDPVSELLYRAFWTGYYQNSVQHQITVQNRLNEQAALGWLDLAQIKDTPRLALSGRN
jgi:hypothetical protein